MKRHRKGNKSKGKDKTSSSESSPEGVQKKLAKTEVIGNKMETKNENDKFPADQLSLILQRFDKQSQEMLESEQRIKTTIDTELKKIEERIMAAIELKVTVIQERIDAVEESNADLRQENKLLKNKLVAVERAVRKNNLVISGVDFATPAEGYAKAHSLINEITDGVVTVSGLRTFQTQAGKKIVVECNNTNDKIKIMQAKRQLSKRMGNDKQENQIFIDDDLSKDEALVQKELRTQARILRETGNEVRVEYGRLRVNGKILYMDRETMKLQANNFRREGQDLILEHTGLKQQSIKHK